MQESVHLIVGAGGGMGRAICASLKDAGARVVAAGRHEDSVREAPADAHHTVDATDQAAVAELIKGVDKEYGRLDGVVNCAGSLILKPLHQTSLDEWQQTIDTNMTTAFTVLKAAVKVMRPKGGSVVLFSSAASRTGLANHEAISAAKAGVSGLALAAASTYARYGIRINVVAPGLTRTPMTQHLTEDELSLKVSNAMHVLGRIGEPEDIASVVCLLLDPASSWITGQIFGVDGGLATLRPQPKV